MLNCIFCNLGKRKLIYENQYLVAIQDEYPVSEGHTLIVSKAHFQDFFMLPQPVQKSLLETVSICKQIIAKKYSPTGFNVGMNCGIDAGQSVMHFHCHLIPRYPGDTPFPKGGVRGVIPEKMSY